ncbi:MAG TPA: GAF domain-containing protein, partial [Anaerolineales bacterium]|nr:GAF domain-containing protein [Anaerolineales bacterium]
MADRSSAQHNEQETRAAELEANYPISLGLASSLDLPTIVNAVRELAFTLIPNLRDAAIFLYHEGQLTSTASRSFDAATSNRLADPQPGDSIYAAAQQGEIVTIPNIEADPRFADSPTPRQGTLVSVPLKAGASVVGVMTLILDQPYTFRELELRQLQVLGAQAAIAIQNAGLYEQAQQELVRHLKAEATLRQLNAE